MHGVFLYNFSNKEKHARDRIARLLNEPAQKNYFYSPLAKSLSRSASSSESFKRRAACFSALHFGHS